MKFRETPWRSNEDSLPGSSLQESGAVQCVCACVCECMTRNKNASESSPSSMCRSKHPQTGAQWTFRCFHSWMEAISVRWADKAAGPSFQKYGSLPGIVHIQRMLLQNILAIPKWTKTPVMSCWICHEPSLESRFSLYLFFFVYFFSPQCPSFCVTLCVLWTWLPDTWLLINLHTCLQ